jgi:hypothetical protein
VVDLYQAWAWTCDECGMENFCRGITVEFGSEEEKRQALVEWCEARGEAVPDNDHDFDCVRYPNTVRCHHCGFEDEAEPGGDEYEGL